MSVPAPGRGRDLQPLVNAPLPPHPGPPNILPPADNPIRGVQFQTAELGDLPIVNPDALRLAAHHRGRERVGSAGHGRRQHSPYPGREPGRQPVRLPPLRMPPVPPRLPPAPPSEGKGAGPNDDGKGAPGPGIPAPPLPPGRPPARLGPRPGGLPPLSGAPLPPGARLGPPMQPRYIGTQEPYSN